MRMTETMHVKMLPELKSRIQKSAGAVGLKPHEFIRQTMLGKCEEIESRYDKASSLVNRLNKAGQ